MLKSKRGELTNQPLWPRFRFAFLPYVENESIKVLWDININTDYEIEHKRPDIVAKLISEKECLIIDIAVPGDTRIKQKEQEKIEEYQDLKREIARL